jgi:hypothetical protein
LIALTADEFLIHPLKAPRTLQSIDLTALHAAGGQGFAAAGSVTALAVHPERMRHPYLVRNDDTIWELDTLTGLSTRFATVPRPRQIVFGGPEQRLHVLAEGRIVSLDLNGSRVAEVAVDDSVAAIAYDTRENRVIAVAPGAPGAPGRLLRFDSRLEPVGASSIPPIPCAAGLLVKDDPVTGAVWLACRGSSELTRLQPGTTGIMVPAQVTLESARPVESFAVASSGHLYVTDGRELRVYDSNGRRATQSPLDGQKAGPIVDVLRSFSNFDPARMRNPQYRNVLPE